MEKLYYNLSEEEFSKEKKILLWGFSALFFLAGMYVVVLSLFLGHKSIPAILSLVPFGISLVVAVIAALATIKRKDLFFMIDDEKIEFRYGMFKPKKHILKWEDIKELSIPRTQKKALLTFKDDSYFIINLTWLQKKKSEIIRKHIYHAAREKNIEVKRVIILKKAIGFKHL